MNMCAVLFLLKVVAARAVATLIVRIPPLRRIT
jgi:hypothetical protein